MYMYMPHTAAHLQDRFLSGSGLGTDLGRGGGELGGGGEGGEGLHCVCQWLGGLGTGLPVPL